LKKVASTPTRGAKISDCGYQSDLVEEAARIVKSNQKEMQKIFGLEAVCRHSCEAFGCYSYPAGAADMCRFGAAGVLWLNTTAIFEAKFEAEHFRSAYAELYAESGGRSTKQSGR
jgi:hypothetical protein